MPEIKDTLVETASNSSNATNITASSSSDIASSTKSDKKLRSIKSAANVRLAQSRWQNRAATAKPKKESSPPLVTIVKEREQGW